MVISYISDRRMPFSNKALNFLKSEALNGFPGTIIFLFTFSLNTNALSFFFLMLMY